MDRLNSRNIFPEILPLASNSHSRVKGKQVLRVKLFNTVGGRVLLFGWYN